MPNVAVIGGQWGDEGKGKVVDHLARDADIIVRFGGGNNAGHTLIVGEERTVLHLIPSGVLHAGKICVIGNGVVVDPEVLVDELTALRKRGYLTDDACLKISDEAHLILPYHKAIDLARERLRGKGAVGTTGRGIGPTYEDKMARSGIRVVDLLEEETFREKLAHNLEEKNIYLRSILKEPGMEFDAIYDAYRRHADRLRPYVTDTALYLDDALRAGRRVLFEGAQGTMLDVDHGTYPYVTSSNTVAGAVCAGAGVGPASFQSVIGICKAYTTRVGNGPFPTEEHGAIGERLRESGDEFGATTGRPRRCGWFDAVVLRYAVRINGLDTVALTKLDVLDQCETVKVCTGYRWRGDIITDFPEDETALAELTPVYEEISGWMSSTAGARNESDLPAKARRYLERLEELIGIPFCLISTGAQRDETILCEDSPLLRWYPSVRSSLL
jgi:adenylosuccinate synthase